jgi:hypothetical protein
MSKESFYLSETGKKDKSEKSENERIEKIKESLKDEGIFIRTIFECLLIQNIALNIKKMNILKEPLVPLREILKEMQKVKENSRLKKSQKEEEYNEIIERMPVDEFFIYFQVNGNNKIKKILALAENDLLQTLGVKIEEKVLGRKKTKNEKINQTIEIQVSKGELVGGCGDDD